ncbi:replication factor C subunit 2-like [Salvelinus alpinus]|uniref:replication factor C subunit 2-like n=1 Tax=Salvelinus alpinus TaxID=8036 RepID=UPI0039FC23A2
MLEHCVNSSIDEAYKIIEQLWALGYSPEDIIGNIFRVCKTFQMSEYLKLEFIKVHALQHSQSTTLPHTGSGAGPNPGTCHLPSGLLQLAVGWAPCLCH